MKKLKIQPSIIKDGKEFVSVSEFARREERIPSVINRYIRTGTLDAVKVEEYGILYMDWEEQSRKYKEYIFSSKSCSKANRYTAVAAEPSAPEIEVPNIPSNEIEDPTRQAPIVDLASIDPMAHSDCWIRDGHGDPIYVPGTNTPRIDWEFLKKKLTAVSYQLKIDIERGKYVEKETLSRFFTALAKILQTKISSIPSRYGAIFMATVEDMKECSFTPDEAKELDNILIKEGSSILKDIQSDLKKFMQDEDEKHVKEEEPKEEPKPKTKAKPRTTKGKTKTAPRRKTTK